MTARVRGVTSRTGHSGVMVARMVRELAELPGGHKVRGSLWERARRSRRVALDAVPVDSAYAVELDGRARDLRRALFVLGRVDGVPQSTHDGVAAALATVEGQLDIVRAVTA